jgi:tRNA (guanine-N7-)-methyltransferase
LKAAGWKRHKQRVSNSTSKRTVYPEPEAAALSPASTASLICRPASWLEPLEPAELFGRALPLEVELGTGDGSFLAQWAVGNPAHNFLGVERLLGRLRKLDRKGRRRGLTNLRLIRIEAGYFLEYLLPRASVTALHVYFPDPWPKRRHRRNRLINEHFTSSAARILVPGGMVFLRTDDADYFAQMQEVFSANGQFERADTPAALCAVVTDFEREFNAGGIATLRAGYRLA